MKDKRGISNEFASEFKKSDIGKFYFQHKDVLFLGIRNNYVNLYYKAASIAKIQLNAGVLSCEIAKKYLNPKIVFQDKDSRYEKIEQVSLIEKFDAIKRNIDEHYNKYDKKEKSSQQNLILNNNSNPDSKWYCVDMEYVKQRSSSADKTFGRFDIIAVSKMTPYVIALIELKYGHSAIGGNSGVLKHAQDYIQFINTGTFENHLLPEIVSIIKSYNRIDSTFPLPDCKEIDFCKVPDIYFITLDNKNNLARQTMRKYVLDEDGSSRNNIEKVLGIDITKPNAERFKPTFFFSDDDGTNITDILDPTSYTEGL